jgi:abnormal spindle-like microcephaly-associated protein
VSTLEPTKRKPGFKPLLSQIQLVALHTDGHGAPPYRAGYSQALAATVLKRTLLLAFLLDRAQAGLPPDTPLLFRVTDVGDSAAAASGGMSRDELGRMTTTTTTNKAAAHKSSAAIVRAALQASCHGEGDVLRHLGHMGYKLYHQQEPIREYDFNCSNLATDLRDGVRLCRLVEVLSGRCGDKSVLRAAKFPAARWGCTS